MSWKKISLYRQMTSFLPRSNLGMFTSNSLPPNAPNTLLYLLLHPLKQSLVVLVKNVKTPSTVLFIVRVRFSELYSLILYFLVGVRSDGRSILLLALRFNMLLFSSVSFTAPQSVTGYFLLAPYSSQNTLLTPLGSRIFPGGRASAHLTGKP